MTYNKALFESINYSDRRDVEVGNGTLLASMGIGFHGFIALERLGAICSIIVGQLGPRILVQEQALNSSSATEYNTKEQEGRHYP
jgi:hypothetical protein